MQDIRNSDGRKVCQVDEHRATVEIRHGGDPAQRLHYPDPVPAGRKGGDQKQQSDSLNG